MNGFKKALRLLALVLLISLALAGVSLTGVLPITPNYRERYMNNEIKIERVDEKDDETQSAELGSQE